MCAHHLHFNHLLQHSTIDKFIHLIRLIALKSKGFPIFYDGDQKYKIHFMWPPSTVHMQNVYVYWNKSSTKLYLTSLLHWYFLSYLIFFNCW